MLRIVASLSIIPIIWIVWAFVAYDWHGPLNGPFERFIFAYCAIFGAGMVFFYPGWKDRS